MGRLERWALIGTALAMSATTTVGHAGSQTTYGYDGLGRVVSATLSDGTVVSYSYDAAGNRSAKTILPGDNTAPAAANDSISAQAGIALIFDPRSNDSDPDNDSIVISAVGTAQHGTVAINGGGASLTYTATSGYSGPDNFSYTIRDPSFASATATVTATVATGNGAPNAVNDAVTVAKNTSYSFDPRANDTDPDQDPLTITAKTNGAHGTVAITGGGSGLTYTPATNYSGSDSFTYTISDPASATDVATVTVTIPSNTNPIAVNDSMYIEAEVGDDPTTVCKAVLANDSDPDGDTLTITSFTQPTLGTVAKSGNQLCYTVTPPPNATRTFTYTVSDGHGGTATATVTATLHLNIGW